MVPPWGWACRALLAYRSGAAESAVKYLTKSEEFQPAESTHALNLAILALAQQQLEHRDEAHGALEEAAQLIKRLQADAGNNNDHDVLIAQILFREAQAKADRQRPYPILSSPSGAEFGEGASTFAS